MADLEKITLADLKQAKKKLEEAITASITTFEEKFGVKVINFYYYNYNQQTQIEVKLPLSDEGANFV